MEYIADESSGRFNTTFYSSYPPIKPYKYDIKRGNRVIVYEIINYYGEKWAKIKRCDNNMTGYVKLKNIKKAGQNETSIVKSITENCIKLWNCYAPGYNPPEWSCQNPDINLMKSCYVFYDNDSNINDIMIQVAKRLALIPQSLQKPEEFIIQSFNNTKTCCM